MTVYASSDQSTFIIDITRLMRPERAFSMGVCAFSAMVYHVSGLGVRFRAVRPADQCTNAAAINGKK